MSATERVILFDGVCNLCNNVVQMLIVRDKNSILKYSSLQSQYGQRLLEEHGLSQSVFDSFIYQRNGEIHQRSTAFLMVMKDLGSWYQMLYAFMIIPKFLRDPLYNLVAKTRYRIWGKRNECYVPTPELESLFLEN